MITNRPPHLKEIWVDRPLYFVTCVTHNRQKILANELASQIFIECWIKSFQLYYWATSDYVIMPDHVHFFMREAQPSTKSLSDVIQGWKQFTARKYGIASIGHSSQLWQPGFFDRLLRDETEWEEKYYYMLQNPVRAGLVNAASDWPYHGKLEL